MRRLPDDAVRQMAFEKGHRFGLRTRFQPGNRFGERTRIPRVAPSPDRLKLCRICYDRFPLTAFNREARAPDGHHWSCRACRNARRAQLAAGKPKMKPWGRRTRQGEFR